MSEKLKSAVFILNVLLLLFDVYYAYKFGFDSTDEGFFYYEVASFAAPILTLIWMHKNGGFPEFVANLSLPDAEEMKLRRELRKAEMQKKLNEMKK